jgi:hypothetical protein
VIRIVSAANNIRTLKGFKISRNMFGKYTYSKISILATTTTTTTTTTKVKESVLMGPY